MAIISLKNFQDNVLLNPSDIHSYISEEDSSLGFKYSTSNNSHYFEITFLNEEQDTNYFYRFFINETPDIPQNLFLYDYFGSGEIFFPNLQDSDRYYFSSNSKFANYYLSEFMSKGKTISYEDCVDNISFTLKEYSQTCEIVSSVLHEASLFAPTVVMHNDMPMFAFSIQHYINSANKNDFTVSNTSDSKTTSVSLDNIPPPLCKHYTYTSKANSVSIKSSNYRFANTIDEYQICSAPSLNKDSDKILGCSFVQSNATHLCPAFESLTEVLDSKTVNKFNTNESIVFNLEQRQNVDGTSTLVIYNVTENNIINYLHCVDSFKLKEYVKEMTLLFDITIASYNEDSVTETVSTEQKDSSNNFIENLLSL